MGRLGKMGLGLHVMSTESTGQKGTPSPRWGPGGQDGARGGGQY